MTRYRLSIKAADVNTLADALRAWSVLDPADVICGVECVYVRTHKLDNLLTWIRLSRPELQVTAIHATAR